MKRRNVPYSRLGTGDRPKEPETGTHIIWSKPATLEPLRLFLEVMLQTGFRVGAIYLEIQENPPSNERSFPPCS